MTHPLPLFRAPRRPWISQAARRFVDLLDDRDLMAPPKARPRLVPDPTPKADEDHDR
jgi:hypothetical protein